MKKTLSAVCLVIGLIFGSLWASEIPGKVDINTASIAELDTLPGIGPAIAARIIDFRTRNGPFRRSEDLMNVRGIGEKKFLKLKARIVISLPEIQISKAKPLVSGAKGSPTTPPPKRR
ncbi:MAG: helix-hairpin-helix domain-containing protein [Acidobacteria bacterium]|nr:MAG: helix-hairpin-helix domain-containing protein [Acidobacteriota bacterium]